MEEDPTRRFSGDRRSRHDTTDDQYDIIGAMFPPAKLAVLASDTSCEAERVQVELWRRMSSVDKAHAVSGISRAVQELSLVGIRQRHPGSSESEHALRLALLKLGRELTCKAYPEAIALVGG